MKKTILRYGGIFILVGIILGVLLYALVYGRIIDSTIALTIFFIPIFWSFPLVLSLGIGLATNYSGLITNIVLALFILIAYFVSGAITGCVIVFIQRLKQKADNA